MLTLKNEHLRVEIDPERGAEFISIVPSHTPRNVLAYYDWTSPIAADGLTNYGDPELDWLSRYRGGWQETAPNAGAASHLDGMPLPFHGEASFIPWTVVDWNHTSTLLETHLRPTLTLTRKVTLVPDGPGLRVSTTVRNTGVRDVPMIWGHHPAFRSDGDTVLHLPPGRYAVEPTQRDGLASTDGQWPEAVDDGGAEIDLRRFGSAAGSRLVYRHGHEEGWAVIRQADAASHIVMAWDVKAYPAVWVWQNRSHPGFPWFGRMNSLAVEPQRAWPLDGLAAARERGQELWVSAGQEQSSWITMSFPQDLPDSITGVTQEGNVL